MLACVEETADMKTNLLLLSSSNYAAASNAMIQKKPRMYIQSDTRSHETRLKFSSS
jgi:hypothetical protein